MSKLEKVSPWGEPNEDFEMTPQNTGFCSEEDVK